MAEELRAELTGSVWKIVVRQGDVAAPGATILILESMKMEIPVETEAGGTVRDLKVAEGDVVQEGDLLAIVA